VNRFLAAAEDRLLCAVALLAPSDRRAEWLREWRAELWHVCRCDHRSTAGSVDLTGFRFCLGALPDALEMRRIFGAGSTRAPIHRSASYCLLILAVILAAGWAFALYSRPVIAERHTERYAVRPGLVLILNGRAAGGTTNSIPLELYRTWAGARQKYFDGLAFYRVERTVLSGGGRAVDIPIVHSSAQFFSLLGLPMEIGGTAPSSEPRLILSDLIWRRDFNADPRIVGRTVRVGDRLVSVAAVLPDGGWRLPGEAEAWLLEPDNAIASGGAGYVIAQLKPDDWRPMQDSIADVAAYDGKGNEHSLWAISFNDRTDGPWRDYFFPVFLALLVLPGLTSVFLSDKAVSTIQLSWSRRVVCCAFGAAKIAMILGIVYILPVDLAHCSTSGFAPAASSLQFLLTLTLSIFGFCWTVDDQHKRCPVCLRRVTHPARVGIASRTFLAWNGTELMCRGGHTLLYIPAVPTSWFYAPRWVYLDPSWKFLFDA
jgi:hypothetical protein